MIKLNCFCCLSIWSLTHSTVMHVIFKKGENAAQVAIKQHWCTVSNCGVI
jgi:hypothetical protein